MFHSFTYYQFLDIQKITPIIKYLFGRSLMSLFEQVQQQIRKSYTYIQDSYPEELLAQVLTHKNIIDTQITLKKDDGSVSNYQAYRCQHVDVRGPFK
ncbi:MAG: hypothetical protein H6765_03110 [Candidatus Peribacteria bacterium]|nr:MAG: hypothetical protein H6765_03110 [Candidatus Peribacteria bacterium]